MIQSLLKEISKVEIIKDNKFYEVWDMILDTVDDIFELKDKIYSWYQNLDDMLWWFYPWSLNIVAGRPSVWKSFVMMNFWLNMSKKHKICFFSFEMTEKQITRNIIMNKIEWIKGKDKDTIISDLSNKNVDVDKLNNFKIYSTNPNLLNILNIIRKENENWTQIFFIDYLQLMNWITWKRYQNRNLEVADITWQLKAIALELNIIIFWWSQLGRWVESRTDKRPLLSDLRDSWSIEQDADVVLMLYRDILYDKNTDEDYLDIIARKNRRWTIWDVKFSYDFSKMMMRSFIN
jgi:replicative DNA helicase